MEIKMIQDKSADADALEWPPLVFRRIQKNSLQYFFYEIQVEIQLGFKC